MSIRAIKQTGRFAVVLVLTVAIAAGSVAWVHPRSPVGRCANHDWPDLDFRRVETEFIAKKQQDGTQLVELHLTTRTDSPLAVLIVDVEPEFPGLRPGTLLQLSGRHDVYPIGRVGHLGDTRIKLSSSPGVVLDGRRLPNALDGTFPVLGRGFVSQLKGTDPRVHSHLASRGGENAIDIDAAKGTPVIAMRAGRVIAATDGFPDFRCRHPSDSRSRMGNEVMILDDSGVRVTYAHLRRGSLRVRVGDLVAEGQQIAEVGSSGAAWAPPHLHISAGGAMSRPESGYGVTVPLRFRVCGHRDSRPLVLHETIDCDLVRHAELPRGRS